MISRARLQQVTESLYLQKCEIPFYLLTGDATYIATNNNLNIVHMIATQEWGHELQPRGVLLSFKSKR